MRHTAEHAGRLAITVLVAILVPILLATSWEKQFPLDSQVIIGILTGIVGVLAQLLPAVLATQDMRKKEVTLADSRTEGGALVNNIRKSYDDLLLTSNALFTAYFRRELARIEAEIDQAAHKFELPVSQDSDTTEMMILPFKGQASAIFRMVHHFVDNDFISDVHARQFFTDVVTAVDDGKVREVRRLLIYRDEEELRAAASTRLMQFHRDAKGFEFQVMHLADFEKLASNAHLPGGKLDFGVYGESYMYRSLVASSDDISGVFATSKRVLEQYTSFFDRCWRSGLSTTVDLPAEKVDVQALFTAPLHRGAPHGPSSER